MIKRVNFTGRRRIPRDRIDIEFFDTSPRSFTISIDFDDLDLPEDATVVLEATSAGSTAIQRFELGLVPLVVQGGRHELTEIVGANVFFTVKVVDAADRFGRILRLAENVRPHRAGDDSERGRSGILPVECKDLGQELWKLEFGEQHVALLLNKNIPSLVDDLRSNPVVYALIYPEIVRRVLLEAIDENVDFEEDDDRWAIKWLRFGRDLHPNRDRAPDAQDGNELIHEWVEEIVTSFCETHAFCDQFRCLEEN
ncbi:MAG: hypothetical protein CMJ78_11825 [Planctomycetaceae bacterium]|nr:hypothetical protein [Planctomycetaceae bacterium]